MKDFYSKLCIVRYLFPIFLGILLFASFPISTNAQSDIYGERINNFDSSIEINPDASILVHEKIEVEARGNEIQRGIYRDYPIKNKFDFRVFEVKKNGYQENYVVEKIKNGVRIRIGHEKIFLDPGIYSYEIIYRVEDQVRFFDDHDELYYNITGSYWPFPIDSISAKILLPSSFPSMEIENIAYTGLEGESNKDYYVAVNGSESGNSMVVFNSSKPYNTGEGMTVSVSWPKGFVVEPSGFEKAMNLLTQNIFMMMAIALSFILIGYYFFSWIILGRDPKKRTIIPQFDPPESFSPSEVRYVDKMRFDNKAVVATIINTSVNGFTKLEELADEYTLIKNKEKDLNLLPIEEKILIERLFAYPALNFNFSINFFGKNFLNQSIESPDGTESITFRKSNSMIIQDAISRFKSVLDKTITKVYVKHNYKYVIPGILTNILIIGLVLFEQFIYGSADDLMYIGFTIFWNVFVIFFISAVVLNGEKVNVSSNGITKQLSRALGIIFFSPFVLTGVFLLFELASVTSWQIVFVIFIPILMHPLYLKAIKVRTNEGRRIQDHIEGFKMFLKATEEDRIKIMHKQLPKTLDIYEKYLPYAIALDAESEWTEQFDQVLDNLSTNNQSPNWYTSNSLNFSGVSFTSSLSSSLSSSIASSSSSGSSGGSSGGGGGGGGGGGW